MKRIFFVTASTAEAREILKKLSGARKENVCGLTVYLKKMNLKFEIGMAVLGIAKVSFGIGTQVIIDRYAPDEIYCLGFCGSLVEDTKLLSPVICTESFQYDIYSSNKSIKDIYSPEYRRLARYPASFDLIKKSKKALEDMKPYMFLMGTGDNFLNDRITADRLKKENLPMVVDQETAAFYQSCYYSGVKAIAIKIITDRCDHYAYKSYTEQEGEAGKKLVLVFQKLMQYELDNFHRDLYMIKEEKNNG
ncbi:5'-methylthioadenosine/S-adenosylhomocysteine nucleosidase [Paramaledivibacter caminithermalis]|nr:5'-methylthioadenosine/S-adenosylhomocysteine nucleosidase [Paramaledivibacter caminithermalis]